MSLKRRLSQPGVVISALAHVGALAATLIAFSQTEKFDDLQETVPVEVVTDNQFNQIMKGDKSAKQVRPDVQNQTEQVASLPPADPTPQAAPPPPPPPPTPPQKVERQPPPPPVMPPPRPAPPQPPEPPKVAPTPPVRDVEAEPVAPRPVPRPVVRPPPPPIPPVVPHPAVAKLPPKPRPVDKPPKVDQLAKFMEQQPDTPEPAPPVPQPAVTHPRPTHEASQTSRFDPTDISKLLNHDSQAQKPSSNRELSHLASLGSPTASAPKMSPSFWAGLDGLLEDQYRGCWSYLGLAAGAKYIPQVRVVYGQDGSLQGQPVLLNPPSSDPEMQNLAESALRAVRRCNPLKIPEQYAPYYEQWRGRVLRFDPQEMAG